MKFSILMILALSVVLGYISYRVYNKARQKHLASIDTPAKLFKIVLAEFGDQLLQVPMQ